MSDSAILGPTMTITTHAVIGAVIGGATGDPNLAFGLGFLSHFLVDIIPHGDREMYEGYKSKTAQKRAFAFVTIDGILAVIVVALMLAFSPDQRLTLPIAMGVIGSVLPDFVTGIYEAWDVQSLKWFFKIHTFFHNLVSDKTGDVSLKNGLLGQAVFIGLVQRFF